MTGPLLWLVRHGETEWSASGKHTSWTNLTLTPAGEEEALSLKPLLGDRHFDLVEASPRLRAWRTAQLAGFEPVIDDDLAEWDYGDFEGLTTDEIRVSHPGWTIWDGPWREGETLEHVAERADRVVQRILALPPGSMALVFSHQHFLRVLTARWLRQPPILGRLFALLTGTVSILGWEHSAPVVKHWSIPAQFLPATGTPGL
ncbi:MAG TPA: histidine phosphatase family protein [Acidimicrobiales bacterium]|nr:histidine phosphatase family protein [Acidimicrobiales bacterium]